MTHVAARLIINVGASSGSVKSFKTYKYKHLQNYQLCFPEQMSMVTFYSHYPSKLVEKISLLCMLSTVEEMGNALVTFKTSYIGASSITIRLVWQLDNVGLPINNFQPAAVL